MKAFAWAAQWYPLAHVRELSKRAPTSHALLDAPLVVWHDAGEWCAARDACPHRGAPLSAGRVLKDGGGLACGYHGWTFDASGALVRDPQDKTRPYGLVTHPTHVCERGLLWVWADAASVPLKDPPTSTTTPKRTRVTDWMTVRVPAPFFAVVENNIDAAHAHHTHHGFPGLDRDAVEPFERIHSGEREEEGEEWRTWLVTSGALGKHVYEYAAPQRVRLRFGTLVEIEAFVTPARAGETILASAAFTQSRAIAWMGAFLKAAPHVRALSHRMGVHVATQDAAVMPRTMTDQNWRPRRYDGSIARVRRFLRTHGPPIDEEKKDARAPALDPWHMHGAHCPVCRDFVRDLRLAQGAWLAAALATPDARATVACVGAALLLRRVDAWMTEEV